MGAWWGSRDQVSERLRLEYQVMRQSFGDTFKLNTPRFDPIFWEGVVQINMQKIPEHNHTLRIVYPHEYPNRPPEAYVVSPRLYSEKHQFEDGQLCLFNPKDGTNYGWNPSTSTAVTVAGWAINWIYAYYTWRITGQWPGQEERIHGRPVKNW
jgi:ubiquitin-protein ligase